MNVAALMNALRLGIARGRVERFRNDTTPRALQASVFAGEVLEDVHLVQQFGFASRPAPGSEAILVMVGGDRGHPVAVATVDRRHVGPQLEEGDVVLFSPSGDLVHLPASGGIKIRGDVELAGQLHVSGGVVAEGDLEAAGDVADNAGTLAALRDAYDVHTHVETQSTTGPPVPTSSGGGSLAPEAGGGESLPPSGAAAARPNPGTVFFGSGSSYLYATRGVDDDWQANRWDANTRDVITGAGPKPANVTELEALFSA